MGLMDFVNEMREANAFKKGADYLFLARRFTEAGHCGPAARLYHEAGRQFAAANDLNYAKAVGGQNACLQAAEQRGEDPSVAMAAPIKEVLDHPEEYLQNYYNCQPNALLDSLRRLYAEGNWQAMAVMADSAPKWIPWVSTNDRIVAEYNCNYFGGLAALELGNTKNALARLGQAYRTSRQMGLGDEPLAWDALHFGQALYRAGDKKAVVILHEAAQRFQRLIRPDSPPDDTVRMDEALTTLAKLFDHLLADPYDRAIKAAREYISIMDISPSGSSARDMCSAVTARATLAIRADELYQEARKRSEAKDYTKAGDLLTQAQGLALEGRLEGIRIQMDQELQEVVLKDPRRIPEHARTIQELCEREEFSAADKLFGELAKRHSQDALASIVAQIVAAKKAFADCQTTRARDLVQQKQAQQAEAVLQRAFDIGRQVGYLPAEWNAVHAELSELKSVELGLRTQKMIKGGDFASALRHLQTAEALSDLCSQTRDKLARLRNELVKHRDRAAEEVSRSVTALIHQENWEEAISSVERARTLGTDTQLARQAEQIARYSRAKSLLLEAGQSANLLTALQKAEQALASAEGPTQQEQANKIIKTLQGKQQRAHENYAGSTSWEMVVSVSLGIFLAILTWWLTRHGLLMSLWFGAGIFLVTRGTLKCILGRSFLAHDGSVHGVTQFTTGAAILLGTLFSWLLGLALALAVFFLVNWLAGRICPAEPPRQRDSSFSDEHLGLSIHLPTSGWYRYTRREEQNAGVDMILEHESIGSIAFHAGEWKDSFKATHKQAESILGPKFQGWKLIRKETITIDGLKGIVIEYLPDSPAAKRDGTAYLVHLFVVDGRLTQLIAGSPADKFTLLKAEVNQAVQGLRVGNHPSGSVNNADQQPPIPKTPLLPHPSWNVGARVLARWSNDDYWYPASIREVNGNLFQVVFDDGITEWTDVTHMAPIVFKPNDAVEGNREGKGLYYPGLVTQLTADKIHIRYDDGFEEDTTSAALRTRQPTDTPAK